MPGEPTESASQLDRPIAILNSIIYDPKVVRSLLTQPGEKPGIMQGISSQIEELDPNETTELFKNVLVGLSRDDRTWTIDRRDVALEILGVIPLDKIYDESDKMSDFLKLLKELEVCGLTPEDALKRLYSSNTEVEGPAGLELKLSKYLPQLAIL